MRRAHSSVGNLAYASFGVVVSPLFYGNVLWVGITVMSGHGFTTIIFDGLIPLFRTISRMPNIWSVSHVGSFVAGIVQLLSLAHFACQNALSFHLGPLALGRALRSPIIFACRLLKFTNYLSSVSSFTWNFLAEMYITFNMMPTALIVFF